MRLATINPEITMKFTYLARSALLAFVLGAALAPPVFSADEAPAAAPKIRHAPYGDIRVVVPLTSDEKGIQGMKLRNMTNALKAADAWNGRFTIKVVLYARGVALLMDPDDATKKHLDTLRSRGVQFEVCANTLAEQGIDFHTLYHVSDTDIVPSGFAEVAYLQVKEHYAVDPVN